MRHKYQTRPPAPRSRCTTVLSLTLLAASLLGPVASPAHAGILSVSGDLSIIATPNTFDPSLAPYYTDSGAVIFAERINHVVPVFSSLDPLLVGYDFIPLDISTPGTYPGDTAVAGEIPSGQVVDSYILHFQHTSAGETYVATGSVTFDNDVMGFQTSDIALLREGYFGLPGIQLGQTGLELNDDPQLGDTVALSADRRTVSFTFHNVGADDDMRIVATPVPEPCGLVRAGLGFGGLIVYRRRWTRAG